MIRDTVGGVSRCRYDGSCPGQLTRGQGFGFFGNMVVGVIGAFLGGFVFGLLGLSAYGLLGQLIMATVGAMVLLFLLRLIRRA